MPRLGTCSNFCNFASDATETQLAAVQMNLKENYIIKRNVNKLAAALLSLDMAKTWALSQSRPDQN